MYVENKFEHNTSMNCETGVTSNLLNHGGLKISDNLVFGIGSGLYFIHFPLVKIGAKGEPLTTYRYTPGSILSNTAKLVGAEFELEKFKNVDDGMKALDNRLQEGKVLGVVGDLYYFEVFPEFLNIHFNNHNIVVYGKDGSDYLVSDPIVEDLVRISSDSLRKARFVKASDNPKGKMYWLKSIANKEVDLTMPIHHGLKVTTKRMLNPFFPFGGVAGMRYLSNSLAKYPKKRSFEYSKAHLTNMIRHQEIVGSGGSGYRKQFGYFLMEAGALLNNSDFTAFGKEVLEDIAPQWKLYASDMAKCSREDPKLIPEKFADLSKTLKSLANREEKFFKDVKKAFNY